MKGEKREPTDQIEIPESKTLKNFWEGIISGDFKPYTDEEISTIIDSVYFSQPPITHLTKEEEVNIKKSLHKTLAMYLGKEAYILQKLAEQEIVYLPPLRERNASGIGDESSSSTTMEIEGLSFPKNHPHFFDLTADKEQFSGYAQETQDIIEKWDDKIIPEIQKLGGVILNKEEKIRKFSDIKIWEDADYYRYSFPNGIRRQVYRNLYKDHGEGHEYNSYGYTQERFLMILSDIRKRTSREEISMLDVGGGLGTAAFEAEQLDSHLHATNLTIDEEPAMYPVETVLAPAEAMPESFREKYDLVLSNTAFRYFTYPDIAFENCLQALSVGGEARLVVESDPRRATEYDIKDFGLRLSKKYQRLKELRDNGFIEIKTVSSGPYPNPLTYELEEGSNSFPEAFIVIVKLKSLKEKTTE